MDAGEKRREPVDRASRRGVAAASSGFAPSPLVPHRRAARGSIPRLSGRSRPSRATHEGRDGNGGRASVVSRQTRSYLHRICPIEARRPRAGPPSPAIRLGQDGERGAALTGTTLARSEGLGGWCVVRDGARVADMPAAPPPRVPRRHLLGGLAAGVLLGALAVVPAVTAQGGDGDNQDSVTVCHFADGAFESAQAPETDFYGANQQGHATHAQDIVPPFVVENPRPGDPSSFDGRNRDERGQRIYDAGCVESAPEPVAPPEPSQGGPPTKVRICHATSSSTNPYASPEPAIANNGDLHGGHLDHTGPVYPADNWGDIIPPYTTSTRGQAADLPRLQLDRGRARRSTQNGCEPPHAADAEEGHADARVRRADGRRASSRTGATTTRTAPPSRSDRAIGTSSRRASRNRGQPRRSPRAASRTPSRSSSTAPL